MSIILVCFHLLQHLLCGSDTDNASRSVHICSCSHQYAINTGTDRHIVTKQISHFVWRRLEVFDTCVQVVSMWRTCGTRQSNVLYTQ